MGNPGTKGREQLPEGGASSGIDGARRERAASPPGLGQRAGGAGGRIAGAAVVG